eukprot:10142518-Alexandrium_andersonii.AAC.1
MWVSGRHGVRRHVDAPQAWLIGCTRCARWGDVYGGGAFRTSCSRGACLHSDLQGALGAKSR